MAEEQNSEHVVSLLRYRMRDLTPAQHQEYGSTAERLFTLAFSDARLHLSSPLHRRRC